MTSPPTDDSSQADPDRMAGDGSPDDTPVYRVLLEAGSISERSFLDLLGRLGHDREVGGRVWEMIVTRRSGHHELAPPAGGPRPFVSNGTCPRREDVGRLLLSWRRLPRSPGRIDLEIRNRPEDGG